MCLGAAAPKQNAPSRARNEISAHLPPALPPDMQGAELVEGRGADTVHVHEAELVEGLGADTMHIGLRHKLWMCMRQSGG